jgi:hypothetical protein
MNISVPPAEYVRDNSWTHIFTLLSIVVAVQESLSYTFYGKLPCMEGIHTLLQPDGISTDAYPDHT